MDSKKYMVLNVDGKMCSPDDFDYSSKENFRIMVDKEAFGKEYAQSDSEPRYLSFCKKFAMKWEPMSDSGHMRYGPEGSLIFDLVSDYSGNVIRSLGISAYSVKGSNMFNLREKPIKEHADLYGDRLYKMDVEEESYVMRYAACHQQFAMIKDWVISHKNMPFGAFEVADSYRLEQSGELVLMFRLRKFSMPDFHVFCRSMDESKDWFMKLQSEAYAQIEKLGLDYEMLVNVSSEQYFEENREFFLEMVRSRNKPALICFYPQGKNYYWKVNVEYNLIDSMKRVREIGTVQIDVGNAERFGISYIDENGSKQHPVILHSAVIGSVERYIYAVMDAMVRDENEGKPLMLPVWLSPMQLRLVPVSDKHVQYCVEMAEKMSSMRVDVDDSSDSVGKKISRAEKDWIPYVAVVGDDEIKSGMLKVRIRESGDQKEFSVQGLNIEVCEKIRGYPFRDASVPRLVSKRPVFN